MPFTPYLNTDEINTLIQQFATDNPGLCTLITLPYLSHEGRTSYALKIAVGTSVNRKGILLLGGTHAREWGSSDILIGLAEKLISAYNSATGITFQGKSYSSTEVIRIVEYTDLFLVPNVNPDGKVYCQSGHDWRKNRNPTPTSIGIDINRNYDIVWDANNYFDPSLDFSYLYDPTASTYHGPSAFSEAETLNVKWLIDTYPNIAYGVDLHSSGQKIMYIWGDDENQTTQAEQNFMNPAYNSSRGISSDGYGEFIFAADHNHTVETATRMHNSLFSVRGKSYSTGQIFHQVGVDSGSSASYFFSRHFTDASVRKIYSYGIEWGTTFQPDPTEMLNIMDDIGSALTELCLCASEPDLIIRDNLSDTGKEPSQGMLCMSPDIIVRKTIVADTATTFGDITSDPGSDNVEIGNDNYIYVRVNNHGSIQTNAQVRVYFAPLTTSCSPLLWQFIDEVDVIDIPADSFKASEAIIWPHVPDPGTAGHFCIIALCGNTVDPLPDTSMIDSSSDYINFISNSNNIAYRNVTFEDIEIDSWLEIPFVMQGFSKRTEKFNIVIEKEMLPENVQVELKLERLLWPGKTDFIKRLKIRLFPMKNYRLKNNKIVEINNIRIPSSRSLKSILRIKVPSNEKMIKQCKVIVSQKTGKFSTGQFTVYLNYNH
jgi:murein tripeptide amidase MpaA